METPGWQSSGGTLIDSNVAAFCTVDASDPYARTGSGALYVEGTDGTLWLEGPGWQSSGPNARTQIDSNVQAFAVDPFSPETVYVEGTNGNLFSETPDWPLVGRTLIDASVQAFAVDPFADGYLYVEGTNGNLFREAAGWQTIGRTWIDSNVQAFATDPDSSGNLYVEGTNGNLYSEAAGWQTNGTPGSTPTSRRSPPSPLQTAICTWRGPTAISTGRPLAGRRTVGRPSSIPTFRPSPRRAARPARRCGLLPRPGRAPLFNNNEPSYLDVEQGAE